MQVTPKFQEVASSLGINSLEDILDTSKYKEMFAKGNFLDSIKYEFDRENENLKNGDKIDLLIDYDEKLAKEAKLKINPKKLTIKVKDLPEAQPVDLLSKIDISFEGLDQEGRVYATDNNTNQEFFYELDFDKLDGLSNGDKVTASINYQVEDAAKMGLIVEPASKEVVVSGLREVKELKTSEIFDKIELAYSGVDPQIDVVIDNKLDPDLKDLFGFHISEGSKNYYAVGDKLKLEIDYYEEDLKAAGYRLEGALDKEYEIKEEDVGHYVRSFDELSPDLKKKILGQVNDLIETDYLSKDIYSIGDGHYSPTGKKNKGLVSAHLVNIKKDMLEEMGYNDNYNNLYLLYKVSFDSDEDGKSGVGYIYYSVPNLMADKDGKVEVSLNNIWGVDNAKVRMDLEKYSKEVINSKSSHYNISKIDAKEFKKNIK